MPIIKSAIKKLRQSEARALKNHSSKRAIKDVLDKFKKTPSPKLFAKLSSLLDKANKSNLLHPNKSSRLKSRLSKLLKK